MVVEREPPKANQQAQPVFGKPATLVSPLKNRSVFNIPKSNQPRPEHHRPTETSQEIGASSSLGHVISDDKEAAAAARSQQSLDSQAGAPSRSAFVDPFAPRTKPFAQPSMGLDDDAAMVPKPVNPRSWASHPVQPALYSSLPYSGGFATVNQPARRVDVDLTNSMNYGDNFGDPSAYEYVDQAKATEDIKALLEGAFEDEDDKPKTRGRKKKSSDQQAELADKLKSLDVASAEGEGEGEGEVEDEDEEDDGHVEGLNIKLLPHQVNGVEWMREKELGTRKIKGSLPKGGILADDMGLGKTIQSISLILTNPRPPPHTFIGGKDDKGKLSNTVKKGTLVVAPLALIKQWEAEIANRVEESHKLKVCVHHGPQRTKRSDDLRKYDVVITTYQTLTSEHSNSSEREDGPQIGCFGLHWYRIILDEAHSIKNRNAKATKACYALRSEFRWCLTGTPMQNNLDELQSLIKFLRIKPYNELSVWKEQIMRPLLAGRGGIAMRRLQYYLKAFMKRRTKNILKADGALNPGGKSTDGDNSKAGFKITERKIVKLEAEFTPQERKFYERLEQRTDKSIEQMMDAANKISYAGALTLLLRLRQACNHSHLVTKSDQEAFETERADMKAFKKQAASDQDIDDMADALGGLSVNTKKCDVCQLALAAKEVSSGALRCAECQADLDEMAPSKKTKKHKKRSKDKAIKVKTEAERKRNKNRRIVDDSDDDDSEEGEGDWVVPKAQRHSSKLGRADGSDDENIEGGGEWIGSDDSQTADDSSVQIVGSKNKEVISLNTTDDDASTSSSEPEESEDDEDENEDEDEEEDSEEEDDDDLSDESGKFSAKHVNNGSAGGKRISTKIRKLLEILHQESREHKFIVFSAFTSMLDVIEPFLRRDGFKYTRYDGSMRNDDREASLERLRNDKSTRVLLCSLKCGSLGLNLTAASRVVILEPFWNPFVEEQAIDRVHRLNQTVDVTVYKVTVSQTVEERILELQEKKRALAEAAIEGKSIAKLSMQDILNLFKHDAEAYGHNDAEHQDLGVKPKVLRGLGGDGKVWMKTSLSETERAAAAATAKAKSSGKVAENPLYGRRW